MKNAWKIGLFAWALAVASLAAPLTWWSFGHLRDARLGSLIVREDAPLGPTWNVELPPGAHDAFTVTAWARIVASNTVDNQMTTYAYWCPDEIRRSNPDLSAGVFGWAGETNLTTAGGSITIASFPWEPYDDDFLAEKWPKGVYTIAGWSTNAVTVTLGGADVTVGPGEFNRNAVPGPADSVVVSGSGPIAIGISRTPGHRFYGEIDGVKEEGSLLFTAESIVTNEIAFVSWRFRMGDGVQIYRSDIGRLAAFDEVSVVKTNHAPAHAKYHADGEYRVGFVGVAQALPRNIDLFDARVLPWWATHEELDRIHANGVEEIQRREIPQWRNYP
jgi:hypothetical protein